MRKTISLFFLFVALACSSTAVAQTPDSATTATALAACRQLVGAFQTELKGELVRAMKAGGAGNAISVCQITAPAIASQYSELEGWTISRTAQRLRNPLNAPDPFAIDAMKRLIADSLSEYHAWTVDTTGQQRLRYVAAIRMGAACVGCHGDPKKFSGTVQSALNEFYLHDEAVNFKPGDLRGVFDLTVEWPQGRAIADSLVQLASGGK